MTSMIKSIPKHIKPDFAWAIGIIDGEGWIGTRKDRRSLMPRIKVSMTDHDTIEKLHRVLGGTYSFSVARKPNHQDMWEWSLNQKTLVVVTLEAMRPYLCKRRQVRVDEVLERYRSRGGLD